MPLLIDMQHTLNSFILITFSPNTLEIINSSSSLSLLNSDLLISDYKNHWLINDWINVTHKK